MTITLAIDTSTSRTCVGIIEAGELLWSGFKDGATAHGPALPALVQEAIKSRTIDEVVVGMGPGPFTGLRIGIAFAHSFALARSIPVRGICSLDAIAAQVQSKDFIVTVDARRKEVYWARYVDGVRVGEPAVNFPAAVEGAEIYSNLFPDLLAMVSLKGGITEPIYLRHPDAVATADRQP
ncbi:MAG: tRNA (adenosine(37)-N6)-threonylcarbamoyltransferase complex dimerization subunit type 1 TsaB [Candidatus Planktophila sp.]|nr:tRNA (adenosine(37)-N6)-threonylcarbamoyltransferase complex dimerization subunit type 1 TsaB [Candidatus Planktophila sp.]